MTAPMTSPECDCRGLPYMPLDVVRLRESDLAALSTGEEFKAAVLLWCAAWNQVPAASLPDDERILARLAGYSLAEWRGLSDQALRGWVRCTDERLYHPVVAEKAMEAWAGRLRQRERASKRWARRSDPTSDSPALPPHSHGTPDRMPRHNEDSAVAMPVKGKCKGKEETISLSPAGDDRPAKRSAYPEEFEAAWRAYPHVKGRSSKPKSLSIWHRLPGPVRDRLADAAARFAREGREPRMDGGAAAMDRWLRDARYEDWLAIDGDAQAQTLAVDEDTIALRLAHLQATGEWKQGWGPQPAPNLRAVG